MGGEKEGRKKERDEQGQEEGGGSGDKGVKRTVSIKTMSMLNSVNAPPSMGTVSFADIVPNTTYMPITSIIIPDAIIWAEEVTRSEPGSGQHSTRARSSSNWPWQGRMGGRQETSGPRLAQGKERGEAGSFSPKGGGIWKSLCSVGALGPAVRRG